MKIYDSYKSIIIIVSISFFTCILSCSNTDNTNNLHIDSNSFKEVIDLYGDYIKVPNSINSIASMSPAVTDIVVALGLYNNLVLVDNYSHEVESSIATNKSIVKVDMLNPNIETIIEANPDIVLISDINYIKDKFNMLQSLGITVINIPANNRLDEIDESIEFVGRVLGKENIADTIANEFNSELENIKQMSKNITNKQSVYFEMESPPNIYTFGNEVFINDILNLVGAKNIFEDENAWIKVSEESIIDKNPDIIIAFDRHGNAKTDNVVNRAGWQNIDAIKNNRVYFINNDGRLSRATHSIIESIKTIAKYIYPDIYNNI